jgi:NAD-dependent SIR2 family protein deacetylase
MNQNYTEMPNGYLESINKGIQTVRAFSGRMTRGKGTKDEQVRRLTEELRTADAIVIGAGAGLSTSAGLTYSGEKFNKYFGDFAAKYGIRDMYTGGFYPFPDDETRWAWWSRHIYVNRYVLPPIPVYNQLLDLVKDKDYFVITTNVDHQFQKAGFDKERLFYTQGDYGLWQCSTPCHKRTYDNKGRVVKMLLAQGFAIGQNSELTAPVLENGETDFSAVSTKIPSALVPYCPVCGEPMTMNLRADDTFVEDEGWRRASAAYAEFLVRHKAKRVVYLELGVGANTPVIIKYPFWQATYANDNAFYACINYGEAFCPEEIEDRSVCIDGDIGDVLKNLPLG